MRFLVVEDDPWVGMQIARVAAEIGAVELAHGWAGARRACVESWTWVILDLWLGERSVVPIIEELPAIARGPRCVVMTGATHDSDAVNAASMAGARLLLKPFEARALHQMLRAAVIAEGRASDAVRALADRWAVRFGWSSEVRAVALATLLGARGRREIAVRAGKSPHTVKHQISAMLQSANLRDVEDFVRLALAELRGAT